MRFVVFESLFPLNICVTLSKLLIHMNSSIFICKYHDNIISPLERLLRARTNQKLCLSNATGCQPVRLYWSRPAEWQQLWAWKLNTNINACIPYRYGVCT